MRSIFGLLCVFGLLVLPVGGCNEVTTPSTAPLALVISALDQEGLRVPVEGAQLCENNIDNCALSDASGRVAIELLIGEETSYTIEKEGYGSWLVGEVMQADGKDYEFGLATEKVFADLHDRVTCPYPMRLTGSVILALNPPFAGATFELVGATGKAYYSDEEGNWSLDLTETTVKGEGGFCEVSAGVFHVILAGTVQNCTPSPTSGDGPFGWPGNLENSLRIPVREGYTTWATVVCPPP